MILNLFGSQNSSSENLIFFFCFYCSSQTVEVDIANITFTNSTFYSISITFLLFEYLVLIESLVQDLANHLSSLQAQLSDVQKRLR